MNRTHLLTVKTKYNINIKSPRMIVAKDTMLEVYEASSGEIIIPLGGIYSIEFSTSKKEFDSCLKKKIFEIVQIHLERERVDA